MFPFAMITLMVGADVLAMSDALLEDEESSLGGSFSGGQFRYIFISLV